MEKVIDKATLSNFEIFGCYFVDLFYNKIYAISKRRKLEHSAAANEGLTSIYRSNAVEYVRAIKSGGQFLKDTIMQLMHTYQKFTNNNSLTLIELQDIILKNFLPPDHFMTLGATEKNFFLNKIIISIVEQFAHEIIQTEYLCMVIDNHKVQKNTRDWQNCILEVQISIREDLYTKFARKQLNLGGGSGSGGNIEYDRLKKECQRLKVSLSAAKDTIKKMLKEKCELEVKLERARKVTQSIYSDMMKVTPPQEPSVVTTKVVREILPINKDNKDNKDNISDKNNNSNVNIQSNIQDTGNKSSFMDEFENYDIFGGNIKNEIENVIKKEGGDNSEGIEHTISAPPAQDNLSGGEDDDLEDPFEAAKKKMQLRMSKK